MRIISCDNGRLLTAVLSVSNLGLMLPGLQSLLDNDKQTLVKTIQENAEVDRGKCSSYIVAKSYTSEEDLIRDNDVPIFFDKSFDMTNYEQINAKYRHERETYTPNQLVDFLTQQFTLEMSNADAKYLAETISTQSKRVMDGMYAILKTKITDDIGERYDRNYYIRTNNKWVLDESIDSTAFIKQPDILCNLNYDCLYEPTKARSTCKPIQDVANSTMSDALNQIIHQFDAKYHLNNAELTDALFASMNKAHHMVKLLKETRKRDMFKYNDQQYNIGLTGVQPQHSDVPPQAISILRDIYAQEDFAQRQSDIIKFVAAFGRRAFSNEDPAWVYCRESSSRLMPIFREKLAIAFFADRYAEELTFIIRECGRLSDNGGAWVDKNSGEQIALLDFDTTEEYNESGFKIITRSILPDNDTTRPTIEPFIRTSPQGRTVSNIITLMSKAMDIDIENSLDGS